MSATSKAQAHDIWFWRGLPFCQGRSSYDVSVDHLSRPENVHPDTVRMAMVNRMRPGHEPCIVRRMKVWKPVVAHPAKAGWPRFAQADSSPSATVPEQLGFGDCKDPVSRGPRSQGLHRRTELPNDAVYWNRRHGWARFNAISEKTVDGRLRNHVIGRRCPAQRAVFGQPKGMAPRERTCSSQLFVSGASVKSRTAGRFLRRIH